MIRCSRLPRALAATSAVALLAACGAVAVPTSAPEQAISSEALRRAVDPAGIGVHLDALQAIADTNDRTRAAGTPGYDASADYVAEQLEAAGVTVSRHEIDLPFFIEEQPVRLSVDGGEEWVGDQWLHALLYSASGTVSGPLVTVGIAADGDPDGGSGCDASDWADVEPGDVALVRSGPCLRRDQVMHAQGAGAAAMIAGYPSWGPNETRRPTLISPEGIEIPVVAVGRAPTEALFEAPLGATVRLEVATRVEDRSSASVVAELAGRTQEVVMLGGHLDSVLDGPGINDNGSGVATILEVARALTAGPQPERTVRFGFWTSEEFGLLGSTAYVDSLTEDEQARVLAYINLDMLGSPNSGRYVYNEPGAASGSDTLASLFLDYLDAADTPGLPLDLHGASDHGPFQRAGIATGGLFSGASEPMPVEDAAVFGGIASEAMDACYHLACDTVDRINDMALGQLGDALAHAVAELVSGRVDLER
jgi:hypothetical protein